MPNAVATRCWGVALGVSLLLPIAGVWGVTLGSQVPAAPTTPTPATGAPSVPAPATQLPVVPVGPAKPTPPPPPPPPPPLYEVTWTKPITATSPLSVSLAGGRVVVAGTDAPMEAYAVADGAVAWTAATGSNAVPVVAGGLVVGLAGGRLAAVNETDGKTAWTVEIGADAKLIRTTTPEGQAAFPVVIALGTALEAYRLPDGQRLWNVDLKSAPAADAAMGDKLAFIALEDRSLVAVELETGRVAWRSTEVEVSPISLVAAGERVYFGTTDGQACAVRVANGRRDWCFPVRVRPIGDPLVHDRFVYFVFLDSTLRVYDRQNGARRESVSLTARPAGGPRLAGDYIAVPLITGEFSLVKHAERTTAVRVSGPPTPESPPTLQSAVIAADGSIIAMVTASTSGTSLTSFSKTAPAAPDGPAGKDHKGADANKAEAKPEPAAPVSNPTP